MTEYDYSPEAFEAHIRKQQQIARWVDKTNKYPPRNPFTPATPAVQALALQRGYDSEDNYDEDDRKRHRRRESKDRPRDIDRERERERERESRHADRPQQRRHRSASHSAATHRPEPSRTYTVPPPLPLPKQPSPTSTYPTYQYPQPKLTSPRDSRHSSRSSSTQVPSPTSYFPPQQQQAPYSAPPYKQMPVRAQTTPGYGYPSDTKYSYPAPYYQNGGSGYSTVPLGKPVDLANAPQYPHSVYQTKQPPLLKRLFMGLTGGNKQQSRRAPRRKRSSSF